MYNTQVTKVKNELNGDKYSQNTYFEPNLAIVKKLIRIRLYSSSQRLYGIVEYMESPLSIVGFYICSVANYCALVINLHLKICELGCTILYEHFTLVTSYKQTEIKSEMLTNKSDSVQ